MKWSATLRGLTIYIHVARDNLGHITIRDETGNAVVVEDNAGWTVPDRTDSEWLLNVDDRPTIEVDFQWLERSTV